LEPLHCQVCGQPGQRLYLCHDGHLAHADCLAPACIDCKRVFCADCAHKVGVCDVCHEPLCRHSQLTCPDCGRHTCHKHSGLCHADNGRPIDLTVQTPPPPEPASPVKPEKPPPTTRKSRSKPPPRKTKPKPKPARKVRIGPKPLSMELVLHHSTVAAYVLGKRGREIAVRIWELIPGEGGIVRNCQCEKGEACQANGVILRPFASDAIGKQMRDELAAFAAEYGLPPKKMYYYSLSPLSGEPYLVDRFKLLGLWKNEEAITEARDTFARLYWD